MSRNVSRFLHTYRRLYQQEGPSKKRIENGLNERHRTLVENGVPPLNYDQQRDKVWLGQHFGRYGLASGVDMRKLWPSVEEINEINELKLYRRASEAVLIAEKLSKAEELERQKHLSKVEKALENYDKTLEDYHKSLEKPEEQKSEAELTKERRIQEIQEYFGYWIDPTDPRFDVMLKQKETEEKKAEKQAQKDEKRKRTVAATS